MKRFLFAVLTLLVFGRIPAFADASETSETQSLNVNEAALQATSREELLLFYDEKDLVTATRYRTPLRKAPAIATIITADEIRRMGARNLSDVLRMVPGIGVSLDELGRSMVEVRGIRTTLSEKILVMMDGHRLNESYTGSAFSNLYSDLTVENIQQVEIIRGPGSALYGANAFLAVINVVTKDAYDAEGLSATASGGSYNTGKLNLIGGKAGEKYEVMGSFDSMETDGPEQTIKADRLATAGSPASITPGHANTGVDKDEAFLKASYGDVSFRGQYLRKRRGAYIGYAYSLSDESLLKYDNFWGDISYDKVVNSGLSVKARLYLDQFYLSSKFEFFPEGAFGLAEGAVAQTELVDRTVGSEMQIESRPSHNNQLIFGVQYEQVKQFDVKLHSNVDLTTSSPVSLGSYQDISSWANFNKDAKRYVSALFVQDEWKPGADLNITGGVRYDHYSDFGGTTNPRLGAVWSYSENGEMKLLYGRAFRAPNFKELYDQNNAFSVGSPNLKPEKIQTYEAGAGYKIMSSVKLNVNYFFSRIEDLISYDTSVSPAKAINRGTAEVKGIELEMRGRYDRSDYWRLNYTYQSAESPDTGRRLPYVPSHRASASVNYALSKRISSHADVLWTGSRPRSSGDTRPKMAPYTTVDVALIAEISKNIELRGAVHNLFNRHYSDPDTSGALQFIPDDFPREGISGMVDLTYKF